MTDHSSTSYDAIILGAGAAGLFCAREAAARGRKVLVLEKGTRPGPKILVSGGGRCNFTNLYAKHTDYVTTNPALVPYILSKFTPKQFIALVKEHGIPFHEKKDGQLFCDKSAKAILDLLLARAEENEVTLLLEEDTQEIVRVEGTFRVKTTNLEYQAPRLVVATGGLSWPQLGATDLGYKIAQQFGLKVVEPSPALCGLTFPEYESTSFDDLSGIHLNVIVSCGNWKMQEDIMITHKGLSGPVILNASLHWRPGDSITINWIPELTVEKTLERMKKEKEMAGKVEFKAWLSERIPRRLAERLAYHAAARGNWADLPDEILKKLAETLHAYTFVPADTFGYRMAEVTRGGVDTREVSRDTLESRKVPGLFFIGEVLDVTGKLGGYNFQWAWSSAWVAAQAV